MWPVIFRMYFVDEYLDKYLKKFLMKWVCFFSLCNIVGPMQIGDRPFLRSCLPAAENTVRDLCELDGKMVVDVDGFLVWNRPIHICQYHIFIARIRLLLKIFSVLSRCYEYWIHKASSIRKYADEVGPVVVHPMFIIVYYVTTTYD